jgi:hypothetical protein
MRRFRLCIFLHLLGYANVLYITPTEDNVFIDTGRRRDLLSRISSSAFCSKRDDIFKGYCRGLRVDLM